MVCIWRWWYAWSGLVSDLMSILAWFVLEGKGMGLERDWIGREQGRIGLYYKEMGMNREGNWWQKWLRYRVCLGLGKVGWGSGWWLVECEIEVLYQILSWGMLEKMKNNPHGIKPAKVQKAGLHTFAFFVKSCPALVCLYTLYSCTVHTLYIAL